MPRWPLFLFFPFSLFSLDYEVHFNGVSNKQLLEALEDRSELVQLQKRPPPSLNALRYRVQGDLPGLIQVLHAFAYYDATITYEITENPQHPEAVDICLFIQPGAQYRLASYRIFQGELCNEVAALPCDSECDPFRLEGLKVKVGEAALSTKIVNAELNLLTELARCGYPLASVKKRKVEVDLQEKAVAAASCIETGPLSKFGPAIFHGLKGVRPRFIERRLAWREGEIYNPDCVEETQKRLLKTDLFSSVLVSHDEALDTLGELPMRIRFTEAKHRQLSLGVFYGTVDGPGVSVGWTHRNVRGMGEVVTLEGDLSRRYMAGLLSYKKPDFLALDQSYRIWGELSRENIYPYLAFTYRFANTLERKIDEKRLFSTTLKVEHINVSRSANNQSYLLLGMPIFLRYNSSDSPVDPTKGLFLGYQATPYQSFTQGSRRFVKQTLTSAFYFPVRHSNKIILALKMVFGSIAGAPQEKIPLPVLFLGGSEEDLRGYRFKSVSPLSGTQPLGGRGAILGSIETRLRFSPLIGVVPFFDFGTVTLKELPQVDAKWYKSVGVGLRIFTFFGPLRFDIGFPLDRRGGVDHFFQIYAAVGQTF